MVYTHIAAGIVSAALAAWSAWQVQAWRYGIQVAEIQKMHAEQMQKAEKSARDREQALSVSRQQAEEKYVQEKTKAATAANRARGELDGLRNELYALSAPKPGTSATAPSRADAGPIERQLLGECASALVGVAAEADRLAAVVVGLQRYTAEVCLAPK